MTLAPSIYELVRRLHPQAEVMPIIMASLDNDELTVLAYVAAARAQRQASENTNLLDKATMVLREAIAQEVGVPTWPVQAVLSDDYMDSHENVYDLLAPVMFYFGVDDDIIFALMSTPVAEAPLLPKGGDRFSVILTAYPPQPISARRYTDAFMEECMERPHNRRNWHFVMGQHDTVRVEFCLGHNGWGAYVVLEPVAVSA